MVLNLLFKRINDLFENLTIIENKPITNARASDNLYK